jgi:thiamine biosynthesis lipoprotein
LREAGVEHAFLHGGTSTSFGLGAPSGAEAWQVAVDAPADFPAPDTTLAVVPLRDASLSVSAVWGKAFTSGGRVYGHVLDPREGRPVEGAALTAVVSNSATEADALSTALLVAGRRSTALLERMRDRCRALLLFPSSESVPYDAVEAGLSFAPSPFLRITTRP